MPLSKKAGCMLTVRQWVNLNYAQVYEPLIMWFHCDLKPNQRRVGTAAIWQSVRLCTRKPREKSKTQQEGLFMTQNPTKPSADKKKSPNQDITDGYLLLFVCLNQSTFLFSRWQICPSRSVSGFGARHHGLCEGWSLRTSL